MVTYKFLRSIITASKRLHQLDHLAVSERNSVMGSGVAQLWVQVIEFLTMRYLFFTWSIFILGVLLFEVADLKRSISLFGYR